MSVHAALKWSFLGELASKSITPIVFVILARLLTPADYGVVAAATMIISFSQMFWDAGMSKAIIQYQGDRTSAANAAFWINNTLGVLVATSLVVSSGLIANKIFHDPRVEIVLQVMALQVLLSASVSVHNALLQKDLKFKHLFWVKLATVAIPGLASIPLAFYGMGYWALVVGGLVGQCFQVSIMWMTSPWKPKFAFDVNIARQLACFGGWVALTGLLGWFYLWVDSLIVGIYLGPHELGLYRTGNGFVMMVFGILFAPLMPVLYSRLSQIKSDRAQINKILQETVRLITIISIPLGFLLFVSAFQVSYLVFGLKWNGVGIVIGIMALVHGFAWVIGLNSEAYRAIGRPDVETKVLIICSVAHLTIYLVSIQYGLEVFLWCRLSCITFGLLVHFVFYRALFGLSLARQIMPLFKVGLPFIPVVIISYLYIWRAGSSMLLVFGLTVVGLLSFMFIYFEKILVLKVVKGVFGEKYR